MESQRRLSDKMESWLDRIPGLRTYRDWEKRRETDKRLREHMAFRIGESRSQLGRISFDLQKTKILEPLDDLDRLSSYMQQMAQTIRYASYGYSGLFALDKIEAEDLDKLYTYDLSLMDHLDLVIAKVGEMNYEIPAGTLIALIGQTETLLRGLEHKFHERKHFLGRPA